MTTRSMAVAMFALMSLELWSLQPDRGRVGTALRPAVEAAIQEDATAPSAEGATGQLAEEVPELSDEEQQQVRTAERFLSVLQKSPRRGTALDRVYGHHVEFGTLDPLIGSLRKRTMSDPQDGAGWMLLGMFESHRGADAVAAEAFQNAERTRPDDPLASFYLAQSQLRIGQSEEAVAALERALRRQPQRADLLEIYQQLGRVHQRAQRTEQALEVWQRFESQFPDDPRVLEQVAVTLAEEGQLAQALVRYERLSQLVKDEYRRVVFQIAAAELKIRTGQQDTGIAELESLLANLNPESWLHRDVRRRMEEVFLKSGDQDNLVRYYQSRLERHPEDVEGMVRLARFLAASARVPEATEWMQKALQRAPGRSDLRKAYIVQLTDDRRIPEALREYEQLVANDPGNADFRRDWGRLILKDRTRDSEVLRREAAAVWQEIVTARPDDPVTLAQTADLFRHAGMNDEALALYEKAVALAPEDPQYREYLGEFLHVLQRPAEALQSWAAIAAGSRRTTANVTRLAEIYHSFGLLDLALSEIAAACELDPQDLRLQLRAAEYHARAGTFDPALRFVTAAEKLAGTDDERESVLRQRIEVLQSGQRLEQETAERAAAVHDNPASTAEDWHRLARYYEAQRQWADAAAAVEAALEREPASAATLTTAARIAETSGNPGNAAETYRRLARADRRSRGDHLMNVARLEAQLGRAAEALAAGQELIVAAPGNTDNYEFVARLCFQLGKPDEGLTMLRKAVRISPQETHLLTALAAALAEQLRTDEAIELYWRAFEKSEEITDKTTLVMKLVPLYQQINQFEQLIERLERERRSDERRREMTICLAQAYHTFGDVGNARHELEGLLTEGTRDTILLQQLASLCEASADTEAAIGYQRQLVAIAPGHETEFPLAQLLQTQGELDEATEIIVRLTQREHDPARLLLSIDGLLTQGNYEAAISVIEPLLSQQRDDWELLYREGVAWASLENLDEAENRFRRLLALTIPHESRGVIAEDRFQQMQSKARSDSLTGLPVEMPTDQSPLMIGGYVEDIQRAVGLLSDYGYRGISGGQLGPVWTPDVFGEARMASWGWLLRFAEERSVETTDVPSTAALAADATRTSSSETAGPLMDDSAEDPASVMKRKLATRAEAAGASREAVYDCLYLARIRDDGEEIFRQAGRLARSGGQKEQQFFLDSLSLRDDTPERAHLQEDEETQKKFPLSEDDLKLAMECYRSMEGVSQASQDSRMSGGRIVYGPDGQAYVQIGGRHVPVPGVYGHTVGYLEMMIEELKLAGRISEADALMDVNLATAESADEIAALIAMATAVEKPARIPELFDRWVTATLRDIGAAHASDSGGSASAAGTGSWFDTTGRLYPLSDSVLRWIGRLGVEQEHSEILRILDRSLDVASAESRLRWQQSPTRRPRGQSARRGLDQFGLEVYFGDEAVTVETNVLQCSVYVDRGVLYILRAAVEVLRRNDAVSDLSAHLQMRAATASGESLVFEQWVLASALWWAEEEDKAFDLFTQLAELLPHDQSYRLALAEIHQLRGDLSLAMEMTDSLVPGDQELLQHRELMALQLAERLGNIRRARQAAERLFGLRLDMQTQLGLIDHMRRLGMHELADAVISRAERQSGNSPESLASLMLLFQGQGRLDQARQLAHLLLQRTQSASSASPRFAQSMYGHSASEPRSRALQLLHQTGDLKLLICQAESLLERFPDSIALCERLLEYYTISGERDRMAAVYERTLAQRPDAVSLRLGLARFLIQTEKLNEACDQYLELVRTSPESTVGEMYAVLDTFKRTERLAELIQVIQAIDIRETRKHSFLPSVAVSLLRTNDRTDKAVDLIEKAFDAFPSHRRRIADSVNTEGPLHNHRLFRIALTAVIPTPGDVRTNPWFGLDEISSYSENGEARTKFQELLDVSMESDELANLQSSIQNTLRKSPDWQSGVMMLALIDLKAGKKEAARHTLETLTARESFLKTIPSEACWVVALELEKFPETRTTGQMLLEHSLEAPDKVLHSMEIQDTPVVRLLNSYTERGRNGDARDLLLKCQISLQKDNPSFTSGAYQKYKDGTWIAGKLVELGFPVDALQIYGGFLRDPKTLQETDDDGRFSPQESVSELRENVARCVLLIDSTQAEAAVAAILRVPQAPRRDTPALELLVSLPDLDTITTTTVESRLIDLLVSLSSRPAMVARIDSRLSELRSQHPSDLSIAIVLAATRLRLKSDPEGLDRSLRDLATLVSEQPLEELIPGLRPNTRQRRAAAQSIPLWLVARECIIADLQLPIADQLGTRALLAARRQNNTAAASAILFEWGRLLLQKGQHERAQSKWSELLKIATERPKAKPKAQNSGTSIIPGRPGHLDQPVPPGQPVLSGHPPGVCLNTGRARLRPSRHDGKAVRFPRLSRSFALPERVVRRYSDRLLAGAAARSASVQAHLAARKFRLTSAEPITPHAARNDGNFGQDAEESPELIPPLTMPQFRLVMAIAQAAAENGMAELSRLAVRESLAGGMPVPDSESSDQGAGLIQPRVRFAGPGSEGQSADPIGAEVASSVQRVVSLWQGDSYPAAEVFDLLRPLVLPPHGPTDVLLYPNSAQLLESLRVKSLGETLAEWAHRASRLDDIRKDVEVRGRYPGTRIPALVLMTQMALLADQTEAAQAHLLELAALTQEAASPVMLELACHAAVPAMKVHSLREPAFQILIRYAQQSWVTASESNERIPDIDGKLARRISAYLAERGDIERVRQYQESLLSARQVYFQRSGGQMLSYDLGVLANQTAAVRLHELSMDLLGRIADLPGDNQIYLAPMQVALASVCRQIRSLPPLERYAAWHRWTMPAERRRTIRMVAQDVKKVAVPLVFLDINPRPGTPHDSDLLCNLTELVAAAEVAGTLDQLRSETELAYAENLPNARYLLPLVLIAQNDLSAAKPLVQGLLDAMTEQISRQEDSPWSDLSGNYIVYQACLRSPEAFRLYGDGRHRLRSHLQNHYLSPLRLTFEPDYADADIHAPETTVGPDKECAMKYWFPASTMSDTTGLRNPWWEVHEDQIVHISGPQFDFLYFQWPLVGNFEFVADCYFGPTASGEVSYGGILVQSQRLSSSVQIFDMSAGDHFDRPGGLQRGHWSFNRVRVQSKNGKQRYLLNDHVVYEESLSGASPWISLYSYGTHISSFRNLRLEGQPEIPREVRLLQDDRMDGWNSTLFGEPRPYKRLLAEIKAGRTDLRYYITGHDQSTYNWEVIDGVLQGRGGEKTESRDQSWVYYHRPLQDAESFRLEFYHDPDLAMTAHPTIGRLAFLLDHAGVRTHWIASPDWDDTYSGIPLDNEVVEASFRRGPGELPLKPKDWNHVDLSLSGRTVMVTLNGVVVFERPLEPQIDQRFGIFRWQSQPCRVRNAVLTGDWPLELTPEVTKNLIATHAPRTAGDRRLIHSIVGDEAIHPVTPDVVAESRTMSPERAFLRLSEWVLPSIDHPNFRLYFRMAPVRSALKSDETVNAASSGTDGQLRNFALDHADEAILCPAVELVNLAHRLGRNAELADMIRQARFDGLPDESSVQERNRQALLALIAITSGDVSAASEAVERLIELRSAGLPASMPAWDRSAELVVAWQACSRPELVPLASKLADLLQQTERNSETVSGIESFTAGVHELAGQVELARRRADVPETGAGDDLVTSQWHPVGRETPQQQIQGRRPSAWSTRRGELRHVPGGVATQLCFQSPLQGKFAIVAECSADEFSELAVTWGRHAALPARNRKGVRVVDALRDVKVIERELDLPARDSVATFRIEVDGNQVRTLVNGHQIHQQGFTAPPDPWLLLQPLHSGNSGTIRNLQIQGTPEIPSEIDLIDMAALSGWRADIYGDSLASDDNTDAVWKRAGDELIAALRTDVSASPCESLLRYQRPLLEDAEIEFEMFSVPGEFEIHPAVGRTAFLLQHNGVQVHHLTCAPFESSGLQPDNRSPLPGAADRLTLVPNDWNRVLLKLEGDQLTIAVNGVTVGVSTVSEPPQERWFGLFRWSDQTRCRVRSLKYRGEWPGTLPAVADQQLAVPEPESRADN